ncbi:MAG: metallopeptidase family protein [Armatimonadetes bacterium]|nr:metallopeptidase family protein [Armatimonadota bacterium]
MNEAEFMDLVAEALDSVPEEFARYLENVEVVVEERPTPEQRRDSGVRRGELLLGLYEGVPLVERSLYDQAFPDRILLFRRPILSLCRTRGQVRREIRRTVLHELAHHFGISDARLEELEAY